MISKHLGKIAALGVMVLPTMAFAAAGDLTQLKNIATSISEIINTLLPAVFALAILAFFYGIMVYVFSTSTGSKKNGRDIMLWALIAVAIMVSLYGIIGLAQSTLGIDASQTIKGNNFTAPTVTH